MFEILTIWVDLERERERENEDAFTFWESLEGKYLGRGHENVTLVWDSVTCRVLIG